MATLWQIFSQVYHQTLRQSSGSHAKNSNALLEICENVANSLLPFATGLRYLDNYKYCQRESNWPHYKLNVLSYCNFSEELKKNVHKNFTKKLKIQKIIGSSSPIFNVPDHTPFHQYEFRGRVPLSCVCAALNRKRLDIYVCDIHAQFFCRYNIEAPAEHYTTVQLYTYELVIHSDT